MFDNIKSLRLTKDSAERPIAAAMVSSEGEVMEFRNDGKCVCVYIWSLSVMAHCSV